MRGINRSAVLEMIRREGAISRSVIAERLQVSIPTVMRIVDELAADGLVRPTGEKEVSGGRKRPLLEFNGAGNLVIGVDLGGTEYYGAVADLKGKILYEEKLPGREASAEENYNILVDFLQHLVTKAHQTGLNLLGAGVGVPGVTDPDRGTVTLAPSLNWTNFPLFSRLSASLNIPVAIENDVNLEALGELWFGAGVRSENLVLIAAGTGVGAGVIINGSIYTGSHSMAGEVGYYLPGKLYAGPPNSKFGALEQQISISAIVQKAKEKLATANNKDRLPRLTSDQVFQAARNHEAWAVEIVSETVEILAHVVAAAQVYCDPDVILLGGMLSQHADLFISPVLRKLEGGLPFSPNLQASTLGYRAAVMGSIVKLMRVATDYYMVQKFS